MSKFNVDLQFVCSLRVISNAVLCVQCSTQLTVTTLYTQNTVLCVQCS